MLSVDEITVFVEQQLFAAPSLKYAKGHDSCQKFNPLRIDGPAVVIF